MGKLGLSLTHWTRSELAALDAIITTRTLVAADIASFPGRTIDAMFRQASKRRVKLGIPHDGRGRPREPYHRAERDVSAEYANGCDALHRATVRMCVRRGITLPGLSPAHTRAIAVNLGIAA